jgi:hypothetical protein
VGSRLPAHTISRPQFNLFKPLRRHFQATPFCRQPLARDPQRPKQPRFKRSTIGSAISTGPAAHEQT